MSFWLIWGPPIVAAVLAGGLSLLAATRVARYATRKSDDARDEEAVRAEAARQEEFHQQRVLIREQLWVPLLRDALDLLGNVYELLYGFRDRQIDGRDMSRLSKAGNSLLVAMIEIE